MIDWLDELLTDLAIVMRSSFANYPEKSTEYILMMQDLSRGDFGCVVPLVRITDGDLRQLFIVVQDAPLHYRNAFFVHYLSRWTRRRKMKALGMTDKNRFYGLRDQLHSYVLGALSSLDKKSVRTMAAADVG